METVPCPHCESREFVIRPHEFPGTDITLKIIRCATCQVAIGVVGEYDMALKMAGVTLSFSTAIHDFSTIK